MKRFPGSFGLLGGVVGAVLILALMVFGALWGLVGLLLAVPLLVCVKLVLAQLDGMGGWAKLLE